MECKICNSNLNLLFKTTVLQKYQVQYYKCNNCGFVQTEEEFWLKEAYSNAITSLDIGLINRNEITKPVTKAIIQFLFKGKGKYLDYGGGYGMFVRMMRDIGVDYYRQDIYCENLFAKHFDITDLTEDTKRNFSMLTAFEVFEHLQNPLQEIEKMLHYSKNIFFSTLLLPPVVETVKDWWYFIPETGQHIALYSRKSLEIIAQKNNLHFYTNGFNFHLLSEKQINPFAFKLLTNFKISKLYNFLVKGNKSLLNSDFEKINHIINN